MRLPKKIAAIAAPIAGVALLVALPASAQTDQQGERRAAPKAEANFASSASAGASHAGAMGMSSAMSSATSSTMAPSSGAAMARPSTKVQTAGTQNGSSQAKLADKVSNDVK